ncbi:MAG: VapC toxin family PIN domain ribonuclease [Actinobacteria bacterium]|nr:MAG: VapC toxin family PIN domain ribonuclease [Actinomycetota bacterium]
MLLDANLLLYAVDADSPVHARVADWLESTLSGPTRVGLPWQSIGAFLRIATHPRVYERPLTASAAWGYVEDWLGAPNAWIPAAGASTGVVLGRLMQAGIAGNLVPDAQLAALAIEHGVAVASADADFGRFPGCRWINPLG